MNNTTAAPTYPFSSAGIVWLKLAVVYLLIGVAMGIAMGASENFTLRPVHAHVNLLGWATLALSGLVYSMFPHVGENRLARIHFWLLNLSLPVMMLALSVLLIGNYRAVIPVLAGAELVAALSVILFAVNIFLNLKKT
ncbi:MAG: cytochrome-c oxidase [Herminiimonas sp.]|nr:cytochrome-c oxidase [Herminiimonas sp.]